MNTKMFVMLGAVLALSACSTIEPPPEPSGERVPINHLLSQWQPPQSSDATVLTPQEKQQALLEARKQQIQAAAAAQTSPKKRMSQAEPVQVQAVQVGSVATTPPPVSASATGSGLTPGKAAAMDATVKDRSSVARQVNGPRPANQIFEKVIPAKASGNDAEKLTPITVANEHGVALSVRNFE